MNMSATSTIAIGVAINLVLLAVAFWAASNIEKKNARIVLFSGIVMFFIAFMTGAFILPGWTEAQKIFMTSMLALFSGVAGNFIAASVNISLQEKIAREKKPPVDLSAEFRRAQVKIVAAHKAGLGHAPAPAPAVHFMMELVNVLALTENELKIVKERARHDKATWIVFADGVFVEAA